jgi:SAM-dependent methyltransferase
MTPALAPDFSRVTERPGQKASALQMHMLRARYSWAARQARDADVLEVACGAGMGLGLLASAARSVTAGDLDENNLADALEAYGSGPRITLRRLDAMALPFEAASFDLVLLFEALYYLPDAARFFEHARRVLRPGGRLLIVSVNPQWTGFNPSPFARRYATAADLQRELTEAGFVTGVDAAFPESPGRLGAAVDRIRRVAVKLHLIPRTMAAKALLKRLFYGRLEDVPARLGPASIEPAELTPATQAGNLARFRVLYTTARKVT